MATTVTPPSVIKVQVGSQQGPAVITTSSAVSTDTIARDVAAGAFVQANGAFVQANAAFIQANTPSYVANSAGVYANGAFAQANSANSLAQSAYNAANNAGSSANVVASFLQANAAFIQANSANTLAANSYIQANSANTLAANSYIQANAAFIQANSANTLAANSYIQANLANAMAYAAFAKANAGGSGSSSGYLANSVIFANTNGYLSNVSSLQFFSSNNTLVTTNLTLSSGSGGLITFQDGTTQATAASGAATDAFARTQSNAAFLQANSANTLAANSYIQANASFIQANSANTLAANSYIQANSANTTAISAYAAANTKLPLVGGTVTGNLIISTTGYIVIQNTQSSISNTSGTITISGAGGIGVGGSIYVGNRVGFSNTTSVSAAYQVYNQAVNGIDTVFG